jgi:hypothetical protein
MVCKAKLSHWRLGTNARFHMLLLRAKGAVQLLVGRDSASGIYKLISCSGGKAYIIQADLEDRD